MCMQLCSRKHSYSQKQLYSQKLCNTYCDPSEAACLTAPCLTAFLHVQDIAPRYSGVLLGMSNTAGVLAGVLGTAATGMILKTGTWDDVWRVAIGLYLVGTVIWNLFSTGEQIID